VRAVGREQALAEVAASSPAVILLQPLDSLQAGLRLLRRIRERHDQPVIILSPHGSASDKAYSLELGADDFLTTPFDPDELTARVRAVLRRGERNSRLVPPLQVGDLSIDFERRILSRDGAVVPLGRTEWLVLRHLARYPGKVVLNTELLSATWGEGYADDLQVLRICISRLRHKLGATRRGGGPIRTFHNVGYALEID
jgi:two-component system KDP operon response regulator KdpE